MIWDRHMVRLKAKDETEIQKVLYHYTISRISYAVCLIPSIYIYKRMPS